MKEQAIIKVENVTVEYDKREIIKDVDFEVSIGEVFVIVGGSGCGKSTLLRQMIGLEIPTEGKVFIDNKDFTITRGKERQDILRRFGVLFQSGGLFASMTIAENIALVLKRNTKLDENIIAEIIDLKLRSVGLGGCENLLPNELSGGMRKRAGIARAMALDPDILFLDEPSSGLDPVTAASLDKLIKELNAGLGTTMVVVSHDLDSIMQISDRIILLDKDKKGIVAYGSPEELKNISDQRSVYNFFNRIPEI